MLRDGIAGAPLMHPQDPMSALFALRARGDTEAASAAFRIDNLLTEPDDELGHPPLNERVTSYFSSAPTGDAGPGPLPRASVRSDTELTHRAVGQPPCRTETRPGCGPFGRAMSSTDQTRHTTEGADGVCDTGRP